MFAVLFLARGAPAFRHGVGFPEQEGEVRVWVDDRKFLCSWNVVLYHYVVLDIRKVVRISCVFDSVGHPARCASHAYLFQNMKNGIVPTC